ncbi:fimbrial protein [Citrobacter braakii]|uniref:fimbrial protein n=1 Tax=Citrobacter braakii TaxID=57706 RepID=UPI00351CFFAD
MKQVISALLLCAPLSALAADATVNLTFSGTLTAPTCKASFAGTNGSDIAFGNINASSLLGKKDGDIITDAPVRDASLKFTDCGGGVTRLLLSFSGTDISAAGFSGRAQNLLGAQDNAKSGLGFALFADKSKTASSDAISFMLEPLTVNLSAVPKSGNTYTWPVYARMVVIRGSYLTDSNAINTNSAGKDLIANAFVNISYE